MWRTHRPTGLVIRDVSKKFHQTRVLSQTCTSRRHVCFTSSRIPMLDHYSNKNNFRLWTEATCTEKHFSTSASLPQLIKELRATTGAPMIECKQALTSPEVNMDLTKAADYLRRHGSAKISSKVSGRSATEGMVGLVLNEALDRGAVVKIGSETDFASRSEVFAGLVEGVARAVLSLEQDGDDGTGVTGGSIESINIEEDLPNAIVQVAQQEENNTTVKKAMENAILAIRENLQLDSASLITTSSDNRTESMLAGYVHKPSPHCRHAGTAAAIVELTEIQSKSDNAKSQIEEMGRKLAMHVVAARPTYLSRHHIPPDVLAKEKQLLAEQVQVENEAKPKPPEIVEKIVNGRLNKFYQEVCLVDQMHMVVEDGKNVKVSKVLGDAGLEVRGFYSAFV